MFNNVEVQFLLESPRVLLFLREIVPSLETAQAWILLYSFKYRCRPHFTEGYYLKYF